MLREVAMFFSFQRALPPCPLLLCLLLSACGDDEPSDAGTPADAGFADSGIRPDTGARPDLGVDATVDSGVDAGHPDADPVDADPIDAEPGDVNPGDTGPSPTPVNLRISAQGHDRLFSAAYDSFGNLYGVGVISNGTVAPDMESLLVKILPNGTLDPAFGAGGVVRRNITVGLAGEVARGVAVQSDGKILISATIEHAGATDVRDRDIAVLRFDVSGTLDLTFGTNGERIFDLSDGEAVGNGFVADSTWSLSVDAADKIYLTAGKKGEGRTDTDFVVLRLDADGDLDPSFSGDGELSFDIDNQTENARAGRVQPDGTFIGAGYMPTTAGTLPIVFRLDASGELDPTFATGGVFAASVLSAVTETYSAIPHRGGFATTGYGRELASESIDWLSIGLDADGDLDTTYGTNGYFRLDVAGFSDQTRSIISLDRDRLMLVGGGRPVTDDVDGMIVVLSPDGTPDGSFAPNGRLMIDLGGSADFFWEVVPSPDGNTLAIVGLTGGATGGNDDAIVFLMPAP